MIECFNCLSHNAKNNGKQNSSELSVSLNFEQRQKSRGRAVTESGEDIAWFLPRAHVMHDGDLLETKDGLLVKVNAAAETLSEVVCEDALLITKAAYHLGNRHVPLQIQGKCLSYQHDHVLDDMVKGLGLSVSCVTKPFHPESGAYHSHSHSHSKHSHDHAH